MHGSQPTMQFITFSKFKSLLFEFTIAACGFKMNSLCGPRCQKGWTALV